MPSRHERPGLQAHSPTAGPWQTCLHASPEQCHVTPRGRFNLVMALLVMTTGILGMWRWRQQARDAAERAEQIGALTGPDNPDTAIGSHGDAHASPAGTAEGDAPMPPWGEPLGANFQAVLQRADAGQARAACRIGVELTLCQASRAGESPSPGAQPQVRPDGAGVDASSLTTLPTTGDYCQGVPVALRGHAAVYLRKAAQAGNRDAMLRYAQGAFFDGPSQDQDHNRYLQDPSFADWYREAVPMAQRALRAGDALAARLLADAYSNDHGLFDALVADDPVQAFSYQLLLSYLRGSSAPAAGALDARQRADAEHRAQRMYRESFSSRPVPGAIPDTLDLRPDDPALAPCR